MAPLPRTITHRDLDSIKEIQELISSIDAGSVLDPVDDITRNTELDYRPLTHSLACKEFSTKDAREWATRVKKQKNDVIWASQFTARFEREFERLAAELEEISRRDLALDDTLDTLHKQIQAKTAERDEAHTVNRVLKHELNTLRLHRDILIRDTSVAQRQSDYVARAIATLREKHEQAFKRLEDSRGKQEDHKLSRRCTMLHRLLLEMQTRIRERVAEAVRVKPLFHAGLNETERAPSFGSTGLDRAPTTGYTRSHPRTAKDIRKGHRSLVCRPETLCASSPA